LTLPARLAGADHALAWDARTVRDDATLAWVQGTAAQPRDRQPVAWDTVPNVDDFAVGCSLLACAADVARLSAAP
jgi:hypothetical protein